MGETLARLTKSGSVKVSADAAGRRIVVTTYWIRENAETIIRFRPWIKAGRAEELFHQTTYATPDLAV